MQPLSVYRSFPGGIARLSWSDFNRVRRWLDERIDLAAIYAKIWKGAAPVLCDSDDTHTR